MNPKLPLDGRIYMYTLTAGRVLTTNVFQINLGQLLPMLRATLKVRLDSCLSTALKMDNLDCSYQNQIMHISKFTACLREGLIHKC